MNIEPPCTLKFESIGSLELQLVRRRICPHCKRQDLKEKRQSQEIKFLQCTSCEVVVALNRDE